MLPLPSYDWEFGLELYTWLAANFKPNTIYNLVVHRAVLRF